MKIGARSRLCSLLVAGWLAAAAAPASAQPASVAAAGKGFVEALAKSALACKSKLSGVSVQAVKDVAACLLVAVKGAAKDALVNLARGLYDDAIGLLKTSAPKFKEKLQALADKLAAFVPPAKQLIAPILAGATAGSDSLVAEAAKCRDQITAIDLATVKATFACLRGALAGAGMAAVNTAFAEFKSLLQTNCLAALGKLRSMASLITTAVPALKSTGDRIIGKLEARCGGK